MKVYRYIGIREGLIGISVNCWIILVIVGLYRCIGIGLYVFIVRIWSYWYRGEIEQREEMSVYIVYSVYNVYTYPGGGQSEAERSRHGVVSKGQSKEQRDRQREKMTERQIHREHKLIVHPRTYTHTLHTTHLHHVHNAPHGISLLVPLIAFLLGSQGGPVLVRVLALDLLQLQDDLYVCLCGVYVCMCVYVVCMCGCVYMWCVCVDVCICGVYMWMCVCGVYVYLSTCILL
jgi:hypothetical protein